MLPIHLAAVGVILLWLIVLWFLRQANVQYVLLTVSSVTLMGLANVMQVNVKRVMSNKQAKRRAHFVSISVLSAVLMTLVHALNVGELGIKILMASV